MISVIIPTYKKSICLQNLRENIPYLKEYEIIIVNDNPDIRMKQDTATFKNVRLIENETNCGFAESMNKGVAHAKNPYIMFLNDDVVLTDSSFTKALDWFKKDSKLFAVSFAQIEKNDHTVGKNILYWEKGFIHHEKKDDMQTGFNAWAEAGACMIDKDKFTVIGGFNKLYSPFYWEDVDLSYQAYRHGFRVVFDSKIRVIHHHESTISHVFDKQYIRGVAFRNQLIFIWKNIDEFSLLGEHALYLFPAILKGGFPFVKGFFQALLYLWSILLWKSRHRHLKNVISKAKRTLP